MSPLRAMAVWFQIVSTKVGVLWYYTLAGALAGAGGFELKAGVRATVYYTVKNSKWMATRVVVAARRTSAPSKGKN